MTLYLASAWWVLEETLGMARTKGKEDREAKREAVTYIGPWADGDRRRSEEERPVRFGATADLLRRRKGRIGGG